MANSEFHNKELETFIEDSITGGLQDNLLLTRFKEDVTRENLLQSTISVRRKLRDHLESKGVPCGKGTGDSIQNRLLALLGIYSTQPTGPQSTSPSHSTLPHHQPISNAKRDFLKINRNSAEQYSGPYEGPIIAAVKRKFLQDCDAFQVPDEQRLSVLHVMLRADAQRYFVDHIVSSVDSVEQAFDRLQSHFMTPAHGDTYTTEWNNLTFGDIKAKNPGKSSAQLLDLLFERARDLQSLLDAPYDSPLLLRDCIIRAVKSESFYAPLITTTIPQDPNTLHTRLHQCIRQQETAHPQSVPSSASGVYLIDEDTVLENDDELDMHYSNSASPFFKRWIMRGSSSFSTGDYRGQRYRQRGREQRRGLQRGHSFRPSRRVSFSPVKNPLDRTGQVLLCSFCNSWFHLFRNCPERQQFSSNYGDIDEAHPTDEPQPELAPPLPDTLHMDRSIDEYNFNTTPNPETPIAKQDEDEKLQLNTFFLSLAYAMEHEANNPQHEHSHHHRPTIAPSAKDVNALYPDLHCDNEVKFNGLCFDEGAPHSVTGVNQWMAYLRTYHVPKALKHIQQQRVSIVFGGKGKNRVKVHSIGTVIIRVPLPANCYFDYRSFVIANDVPMLLGLDTQRSSGLLPTRIR